VAESRTSSLGGSACASRGNLLEWASGQNDSSSAEKQGVGVYQEVDWGYEWVFGQFGGMNGCLRGMNGVFRGRFY